MGAHHGYRLPEELARHASKKRFAPDELRRACRSAGEGLGRGDARAARFRSAAEMVGLWSDLDLPTRAAPYALRDARLGGRGEISLEDYPNLRAWMEGLEARESYKAAV